MAVLLRSIQIILDSLFFYRGSAGALFSNESEFVSLNTAYLAMESFNDLKYSLQLPLDCKLHKSKDYKTILYA